MPSNRCSVAHKTDRSYHPLIHYLTNDWKDSCRFGPTPGTTIHYLPRYSWFDQSLIAMTCLRALRPSPITWSAVLKLSRLVIKWWISSLAVHLLYFLALVSRRLRESHDCFLFVVKLRWLSSQVNFNFGF